MNSEQQTEADDFTLAVRECKSHTGQSIADLSTHQPLLIVFLRHDGCTFCRQALGDLSRQRLLIESGGVALAVVHMFSDQRAETILQRYSLTGIPRFYDPKARLYRAFDLSRGRMRQLLGLSIWLRGFKSAILGRHGFGWITSDPAQMPGTFLVHQGQIIKAFRARLVSDRPDYGRFACDSEASGN